MNYERLRISELSSDPANVRKHGERNLESIKSSLRRFGQQKPIVVDGNGIVRAGNGTLAAAQALGWEYIDVVRTALTGSEATAYAIADNRTSELATWDGDGLVEQLQALIDEDEALAEAAGYTTAEVDDLLDRFDIEDVDMPELADGDKEPMQQMTFTLHDEQAELVKAALKAAKVEGEFDQSLNSNENGNALARIAETYLGWAEQKT